MASFVGGKEVARLQYNCPLWAHWEIVIPYKRPNNNNAKHHTAYYEKLMTKSRNEEASS